MGWGFEFYYKAVLNCFNTHYCCFIVICVVAAVASYFEIDDDSAVAWYFLEISADYFSDLEDVAESAICRLHLRVLVELSGFL